MNRGSAVSPSTTDACGYKIVDGSALISPRRTSLDLGTGAGGEAWRMSARGLCEMEATVRRELRGPNRGDFPNALLARKVAGARAEAMAGYSVDGRHEWNTNNRHSSYIPNVQARVSAANVILEDSLDSLHALDRISDAAILCFVSFPEARPENPTAIVHQFFSRVIMRNPANRCHLQELADFFRSNISQPLVDRFTATINPNNPIIRTSPQTPSEGSDSMTEMFRDLSLSPAETANETWFSDLRWDSPPPSPPSPPSPSTSSLAPTVVTRAPRTVTDALDFGTLVEEALTSLRISEIAALKVKLIVLRAPDETSWAAMFRDVGLSADAAALVALIVKRSAMI